MALVGSHARRCRARRRSTAIAALGARASPTLPASVCRARRARPRRRPPYCSAKPWYCCAEPGLRSPTSCEAGAAASPRRPAIRSARSATRRVRSASAGVCERPVRPARGSLVGSRDPGAVSRRGAVRSTRCWRRCAARAVDGIIAVGDRPDGAGRALAQRLGLPGNPPEAAARSRNKLATREAFAVGRSADARFSGGLASTTIPLRWRRGVAYPVVLKPLALSGSRGVIRVERRRRSSSPRSSGCGACCRRATSGSSATTAHERVADRIVHSRRGVRGRRAADARRVAAARDLRQAGPARRSVLRGDDLRDAVAAPPAVQAAHRRRGRARPRGLGLDHGPVHAECRVNAATASVCMCSRWPRGRSAGCVRRRCDSIGRARGRSSRSRRCCCVTRSARTSRAIAAKRAASGVMMIPIPAARRLPRRRRRRGGARGQLASTTSGSPRSRTRLLVPLPEGTKLSGVHLRARTASLRDVERALREAHARLEFVDRTRAGGVVAAYLVCCGT